MDTEHDVYRKRERQVAIAKRKSIGATRNGYVVCDYCRQAISTDLHEIFYRSITRKNTDKRFLCYSRYVVSLLCRDCHNYVQSTPSANMLLLDFNRALWGAEVVDAYIDMMKQNGVRVNFQGM